MYKKYIKRILDIAVSVPAIIILAIPAIIIMTFIKLDSKGPIFFRHKRFGQNKKVFTIYKFRSMSVDAPVNCPTNDLIDYQKYITKFGKFLRLSSIDELPQLINIIKGEMSLVGPRPVILNETELIAEREKYDVNSFKPGITGWAQVNGRDELLIKEKARMDGEYARGFGVLMDLKCLMMTFKVIASARGHKEANEILLPKDIPQQIINELCNRAETTS